MDVNINKLNLQDTIDVELLNVYLYQSRIAVYCALAFALYLAGSFYQIASAERVMLWVFLIFSLGFYTIYSSLQYTRDLPIYHVGFFRKRQHYLHFLSGLAWGAAFFILIDENVPESGHYRIMVAVAIMMAISSSSKAVSFRGLVSFVVAATAISAWYFIANFPDYGWWFFGSIGLACMTLFFGWMTNKYILSQVERGIINTSYVDELRGLHAKIEKTNEDFLKRNLELQDIQEQLKLLASNDALTGLHNRRYILERIEEKLPEVRRHQLDCCFVMMDIDYFKDVNDNYGHRTGDDVLKAVASVLENGIRKGDIVARYGGEEFLIFLPMTEVESAHVLVERLRLTLEQYTHKVGKEMLTVTASFGIAQHEILDSADKTIARADKALYEAKKSGRNCIVTSSCKK